MESKSDNKCDLEEIGHTHPTLVKNHLDGIDQV